MKRLRLLCLVIGFTTFVGAENPYARDHGPRVNEVIKRLVQSEAFNESPHTMDRMRWQALSRRHDEQAFDYLGNSAGLGYKNALKHLQHVADKGNAKAAYRLGRLYQKGQGVSQNDEQALRYMGLAANSGYARAQYRMGKLAESGFGALAADTEVARGWYKQAYAAGRSKSLQALERLLKEDASKMRESRTPWMDGLPGFGGTALTSISQADGKKLLAGIMPQGMGLEVNDRGILNITPMEIKIMRVSPERRAQVQEVYELYNRLAGSSDAITFERYYKYLKQQDKERDEDQAREVEEKDLIAAITLLRTARNKETPDTERTKLFADAEAKLIVGNEVLLRSYGTRFDAEAHDIVVLPALRSRPYQMAEISAQAEALFADDKLETILFLCRQYAKTYAKVYGKKVAVKDETEELPGHILLALGVLHGICETFKKRFEGEEWSALQKGWEALCSFMMAASSGEKIDGVQKIEKGGESIWVSKRAALLHFLQLHTKISYVHLQVLNDFMDKEPEGLATLGLRFDAGLERFVLPNDALRRGAEELLSVERTRQCAMQLRALSLFPNVREFIESWETLRMAKREKAGQEEMAPLAIDSLMTQWYAAIRTIMIGITSGTVKKEEASLYMKYVGALLPRAIGRGSYKSDDGKSSFVAVPALLKPVPSQKHGQQAALMREIREQLSLIHISEPTRPY